MVPKLWVFFQYLCKSLGKLEAKICNLALLSEHWKLVFSYFDAEFDLIGELLVQVLAGAITFLRLLLFKVPSVDLG